MTNTMPVDRRVCVLDAGPIIHLDEIDSLDLLHHLGKLVVPESVAWEAEKHRPGVSAKLRNCIVADAETMSAELLDVVSSFRLHAGEIAALSWAAKFGAEIFVSDDKQAREAASVLRYRSIGTLGVIETACNLGALSTEATIALLNSLPMRSTLFVRPALLADVLARLR